MSLHAFLAVHAVFDRLYVDAVTCQLHCLRSLKGVWQLPRILYSISSGQYSNMSSMFPQSENLIGLVALPVKTVSDQGGERRWFELLDRWGQHVHDSQGRISMIQVSFDLSTPSAIQSLRTGSMSPALKQKKSNLFGGRQTLSDAPGMPGGGVGDKSYAAVDAVDASLPSVRTSEKADNGPSADGCLLLVKAARNLPLGPQGQLYDTFACVTTHEGGGSFKTRTTEKSLYPHYNQVLPIPLPQKAAKLGLRVSIYRTSQNGRDEIVGTAQLPEGDALLALWHNDTWLPIVEDAGNSGGSEQLPGVLVCLRPLQTAVREMMMVPMSTSVALESWARNDLQLESIIGAESTVSDGQRAVWSLAVVGDLVFAGGQDFIIK